MLAIHKPFPTFKTTTFGTLAFVIGLGGTIGLLTFMRPHTTDTGQTTANVATSPSSPDTSKKTATGTTTSSNKTTPQASTADPQPATQSVFIAPVSQQPTGYLQPSSSPVVQSLASPAPTSTSTQSSTSTATSTPPSNTQTTTTTTPPDPTSSSSGSGVISGTLQGTIDGIPVDPTLSAPLP